MKRRGVYWFFAFLFPFIGKFFVGGVQGGVSDCGRVIFSDESGRVCIKRMGKGGPWGFIVGRKWRRAFFLISEGGKKENGVLGAFGRHRFLKLDPMGLIIDKTPYYGIGKRRGLFGIGFRGKFSFVVGGSPLEAGGEIFFYPNGGKGFFWGKYKVKMVEKRDAFGILGVTGLKKHPKIFRVGRVVLPEDYICNGAVVLVQRGSGFLLGMGGPGGAYGCGCGGLNYGSVLFLSKRDDSSGIFFKSFNNGSSPLPGSNLNGLIFTDSMASQRMVLGLKEGKEALTIKNLYGERIFKEGSYFRSSNGTDK